MSREQILNAFKTLDADKTGWFRLIEIRKQIQLNTNNLPNKKQCNKTLYAMLNEGIVNHKENTDLWKKVQNFDFETIINDTPSPSPTDNNINSYFPNHYIDPFSALQSMKKQYIVFVDLNTISQYCKQFNCIDARVYGFKSSSNCGKFDNYNKMDITTCKVKQKGACNMRMIKNIVNIIDRFKNAYKYVVVSKSNVFYPLISVYKEEEGIDIELVDVVTEETFK